MRGKILELLKKKGAGYLSGEEIAHRLGITRAAVWKQVQSLRGDGYAIESRSKSGYALKSEPKRLLARNIQDGLQTECLGHELLVYDAVDSTNEILKKLAMEGAAEGTVVVAEAQGKGKGRLARAFFSPPFKGLWFSVLLRPPFLPQDAPKCTFLSAVAVLLAMQRFGLKAGIKWPNDIMAQGKKLVGILTEMHAEMERVEYIVIGTGINVNIAQEDFPVDIQDKATSLSILAGEEIPRCAFFQAVLEEMDKLYLQTLQEGFAPLLALWQKFSLTIGQKVHVIGIGTRPSFYGLATGIDEEGALLVKKEDGQMTRVLAGDVSIRPQEENATQKRPATAKNQEA